MISIGPKIAALGASRSLDRATDTIARTSERLSSGLRLNRASDDAAGIAIADALRSRAELFEVAGRNINDGISAINIASSAIDAQITIVQRLAELSAIQGQFGAAQSQLASSLRGTESSRINNLAAESRIRNVDVAEETARRALAQIRQQTSAQVLSQAVQQPTIALALLQN
ncbi:MAG: hypothetical protein RL417_628 [Pseudomonadota bacterium]